ncbi:MAG: sterol desaturase family protein [Pseudomonadota bacterium]
MDWLFISLTEGELFAWEETIGNGFYVISIGFFAFEIVRYLVQKRFSWTLAGDSATNFLTQILSVGINAVAFAVFYFAALAFFHRFALFDISVTWTTVLLCVVLADLMYYWEHRFSHRVGLAWATHTVHHSSPHFNISVAYRFGPMDGFWPLFFHIPLVIVGFSPIVVLVAELFVLTYQTLLHTETIGKLPKPIEFIFNTPSHHRVHHGANEEYIDKNYGGVFIVWDRLFGTFAEERADVVFGVTEPLKSVNPFVVFFHGFTRLWRDVKHTPGWGNKLAVLIKPPGWRPSPTGVLRPQRAET